MKKFLALAAAGILCVSAAGCGKTEELVQETVKEIEKAADDAADKAGDAVDEATDAVEAFIPEVAVPDGIAGSYDTGLIMTDNSLEFGDVQMYLPYSSANFVYDDAIIIGLKSLDEDVSIYANVYDDAETMQGNIDSANEGEGEVQELTIGDYDVVAYSYSDILGANTEYYVDFGGKFGDIPGARISASSYSDDMDRTNTDEIKSMIENIFVVE